MTGDVPRCKQVNLVVGDMDATIAFYGLLGVPVRSDGGEWPPGSGARHVELDNGEGLDIELDNQPMAAIWHAGWRTSPPRGARAVLSFSVGSREEVDERYRTLVDAGHEGVQEPYDTFFGARYAVVRDPDGNDVGLMSPIDPARRYVPDV